jgi:hypothetical protein
VTDTPPAHVAPDAPPAADDVREDGPSPVYYRVPAGTTRIPYRVVLGAADRPAWTSADARAAFAFEIGVGMPPALFSFPSGAQRERSSPWAGVIDLGYAYGSFSEHIGFVGFGPHVRGFLPTSEKLGAAGPLHASLIPHLALGAREGDFAVGARTSLAVGYSYFGVTLAHQVTHTSVNVAHALYVMVGIVGSGEVETP